MNMPNADGDQISQYREEQKALDKRLNFIRKFHYSQWLVGTLGVMIFSQAASFGRWNTHSSVENNFNDHANLLWLAGLALLFSSIGLVALHRRTEVLEKEIEKLKEHKQ